MTDTADCVLQVRSDLGESPIWHAGERRLYWIDLFRPALHRFDPRTAKNETSPVDLGRYVGGLAFRSDGSLLIVDDRSVAAVDFATGLRTTLCVPEPDRPGNVLNDCKCDRQGRLWTGSADRDYVAATGHLYVIDRSLTAQRIDSFIACSNGPAFSPDGRIAYFADSTAQSIYRYDIDPGTGTVGPRRPFVTVTDKGVIPDGMTVDAEGFLWCAHWGGWRVVRYAPDGRLDRVINLPVPQPTAPAFGGDGFATLYFTSAATGLSEADLAAAPLSGSLFACDPGVRGLPEPPFAG